MSVLSVQDAFFQTFQGIRQAFWPGCLSFLSVSVLWALLGFASPLKLSLSLASLATTFAALSSAYATPVAAPNWLQFAGPRTTSFIQLVLVLVLTGSSLWVLTRRLLLRYESIAGDDRLALSPEEEDYAYRDLVQSALRFVLTLFAVAGLWSVADVRPSPVVSPADPRELRPSLLLMATHSGETVSLLRKKLGSEQYNSWVVFGSPKTSAKFDEILQCRYPIRLSGKSVSQEGRRIDVTPDTLVPLALSSVGYSVNLMHSAANQNAGMSLQMLSRAYAHLKLFRRFGLLPQSRVFHTTDVQLAHIREALSASVQRGEPAFITTALRTVRSSQDAFSDHQEFRMFLDGLDEQGWLEKLMFVVLELPAQGLQEEQLDLSLHSTTARVAIWMPRSLADLKLASASGTLVRGIDLGASITARLSTSSLLSQCDGATLFDLSERPSLFPRELVYQELEIDSRRNLFRKRGWLSSDGYRLEVQEFHNGVKVDAYRFSMKQFLARSTDDSIEETPLIEETVIKELNRQLDEFLKGAGVEVLSLGNGRVGYSEPLRKVKFLAQ